MIGVARHLRVTTACVLHYRSENPSSHSGVFSRRHSVSYKLRVTIEYYDRASRRQPSWLAALQIPHPVSTAGTNWSRVNGANIAKGTIPREQHLTVIDIVHIRPEALSKQYKTVPVCFNGNPSNHLLRRQTSYGLP